MGIVKLARTFEKPVQKLVWPEATGALARVLGLCSQGFGRSRKSFILGGLNGPDRLPNLTRMVQSPSTFLEVLGGRPGPLRPPK